MSLSDKHKEALNKLYQYREDIENSLAEIDALLMVYFPDRYAVYYQHIVPQIKTALRNNTRWLSRSDYSIDNIIADIEDKIVDNCSRQGVSKFIR